MEYRGTLAGGFGEKSCGLPLRKPNAFPYCLHQLQPGFPFLIADLILKKTSELQDFCSHLLPEVLTPRPYTAASDGPDTLI